VLGKARVVKRCRDLPGQELFQYFEAEGQLRAVDSADVNEYLKAIGGDEFSAKDFRTWAGTVLAAQTLQGFSAFESQAEARRNVVAAVTLVAGRLGNTLAVCRKCYVHPAVFDAYLEGSLPTLLTPRVGGEQKHEPCELSAEETAVLAFLAGRTGAEVVATKAG
jgi:DNA topoisomerase-1